MSRRDIVLASGSRYRAELLRRVFAAFEQLSPALDESALAGETTADTIERLSRGKARSVATLRPDALIIASDQLAISDSGRVLGKPANADEAIAQLEAMSGQSVHFMTGVCVLDARTGDEGYRRVDTEVRLRALRGTEIRQYVAREQPFDCAGSFKAEALGIALLERVRSDDPTALIGLPLITTLDLLRLAGCEPLPD